MVVGESPTGPVGERKLDGPFQLFGRQIVLVLRIVVPDALFAGMEHDPFPILARQLIGIYLLRRRFVRPQREGIFAEQFDFRLFRIRPQDVLVDLGCVDDEFFLDPVIGGVPFVDVVHAPQERIHRDQIVRLFVAETQFEIPFPRMDVVLFCH